MTLLAGRALADVLEAPYREPPVPYQWRTRTYPWARATIARAEAVHGPVRPACLCGAPMGYTNSWHGYCTAGCGRSP